MTVKKVHAQDGAALDDCMESLLEVLVELLEEKEDPASSAELHSAADRATHVVVNDQGE
jgi:hypothetical protein